MAIIQLAGLQDLEEIWLGACASRSRPRGLVDSRCRDGARNVGAPVAGMGVVPGRLSASPSRRPLAASHSSLQIRWSGDRGAHGIGASPGAYHPPRLSSPAWGRRYAPRKTMLLTITTTHRPATDLGYLLHKNPRAAVDRACSRSARRTSSIRRRPTSAAPRRCCSTSTRSASWARARRRRGPSP